MTKRKSLLAVLGLGGLIAVAWVGRSAIASKSAPGASAPQGTAPPPEGWANRAPTLVERALAHEGSQLLEVSQGELRTWIRIPPIGAEPGDYVLLGQGTLARDVEVPELGEALPDVVQISHAQVVDYETARRASQSDAPLTATIERIYADSSRHENTQVVVGGTVAKAPSAIGWNWVHLQDGSGDPSAGTHDLTIKTGEAVEVGEYVVFRGTLRTDVDLGFGYHYVALVEDGQRLDGRDAP